MAGTVPRARWALVEFRCEAVSESSNDLSFCG